MTLLGQSWWRTLLGCASLAVAARGVPAPALVVGSAWYPEHSTAVQIEADLSLMQSAGLRVARVGEFAWSSLEPEEGHYTLEWLDHVVAAAAAHGVYLVLGTPTDQPPRWLERKYPDILRVDFEGRRLKPGAGRAFSISSPRYRELCRGIVGELARRYGHNPNVIGWQIGNEPTEESYDPAAQARFRAWLQRKYGTLAALNQHWQTWYWSRDYADWSEIELPGNGGTPGLFLDSKRFVSSEWTDFHRDQAETIRRAADPRQFITTNFGGLGWADRFNRREVAQVLDFPSWDNYVGVERFDPARNAAAYSSSESLDPWRNAATHDLVRGWRQRNFWLMELQPAFVDWAPVSNALPPGVTRDLMWEAVGHGADGISFWQWKAGLNADGQYHGTLVGPDDTAVPVFAEVERAAREMAAASAAFGGTTPHSEVAILHDYESRWAIDSHRQTQRYDQVAVLLGYYQALRERTQSVDIVDPAADLSRYKLIAAPSLNIISAELGARLERYVRDGGTLLLGPRSGMKDEFNALNVQRQPGPLVPALGGRVEQYYALIDPVPVSGPWGAGQTTVWAEDLAVKAPDAQVMLRYGAGNGWLTGHPAAILRALGRGRLAYLGGEFDLPVLRRAVNALADAAGPERPAIPAPPEVEVCRRVAADREVFVLINHGSAAAEVPLPGSMTNVLTGATVGQVSLPSHEIAILRRSLMILPASPTSSEARGAERSKRFVSIRD